jgi:uncharacterized protein
MKSFNFTGLKLRWLPAVIAVLLLALTAAAQDIPQNTGFVNDYAGVIDASTKATLEKRLTDLRDKTDAKIEIGVLAIKTTGGKDIFDYSINVARAWKIGSKEQDNPALLLVIAVDDRKYFTQVSRDAEGDIPDALAGQIQRQYLVPAFKQAQYGKGINDTVEAYIRRFGEVRGFDPITFQKTEPGTSTITAPPVTGRTGRGGSSLSSCLICGGIIAIIIVIFIISAASGGAAIARRSSWNGGAFGGAGRRRHGNDVTNSATPWIIGSIIGSLLSGGGGSSGRSGSSDWGGSSGGGGGGDWGGFGGGGDFGGGGAGGDW